MPRRRTSIPVGTQFSPALIDLRSFLGALIDRSGDKRRIAEAVWAAPVRLVPPARTPTRRRADLPVEAAVGYGLLDSSYEVTPETRRLAKLKGAKLYGEFARHILLRCNGVRVVEGIHEMVAEGREVTGDMLATYLTDQGFPVTIHNTAINSLRMWMEKAGVFLPRTWEVDAGRVEELIGLDRADIAALVGLDEQQQVFLRALCRVDPHGACSAADIREMAEQILGHRIQRDSLPKRVLVDLKALGYLDFKSGGTAGGKATKLWTLPKFRRDVLEPFLADAIKSLDSALTAYFQTPPSTIYKDLNAADRARKGKALEAYAVHIMRLMGFRFVGWRKRAKDTTGCAEVDVVLTGLFGNSPTRWQVQCKNTPSGAVDLEEVAKEVGLLPLTKATHVLVIANCGFTRDARRFTSEINAATSVTIFLLDQPDFNRVRTRPAALASILRVQAEALSRLKRPTTLWGW